MTIDTIDELLDALNSRDEAAAQQVFLAYEPYLRLVVRRMLPARLRSKFDSVDVVQSVWADVLVGFRASGCRFASAAHLRAFLLKATRNRFIDKVRQQRVPMAHQRSLDAAALEQAAPANLSEPCQLAQADELWERMRALCAEQHQPLLELRRQGCTLDDIAERTGFHPSSVRRIFYDLARQLALSA